MSRSVRVHDKAHEALQTLAENNGTSVQAYLDALLNYAWSQHRRPGSWEADCKFDFSNYDPRSERAVADRWWW